MMGTWTERSKMSYLKSRGGGCSHLLCQTRLTMTMDGVFLFLDMGWWEGGAVSVAGPYGRTRTKQMDPTAGKPEKGEKWRIKGGTGVKGVQFGTRQACPFQVSKEAL